VAKNILSISLINGTFQYLEVEKQPAGFFPFSPPTVITEEALMSACRKADDIYINGFFSTAIYEWELFPKVAKRYLNNLVDQDARGKLGAPGPLQVQHTTIQEVIDAGIAKWQVAYVAIEDETIGAVWDRFKDFTKKIKRISPLPVALASTIAQIDHPAEDFFIVWVGEDSSAVSISDAQGLVKVARNVPIGLPKKDLPDDPEFLKRFSQSLGKEISMTLTFFKQQFRASVPKTLYLVGNNHLQDIFQQHPLSGVEFETKYGLAATPVQAMLENEVNENIHLIGNLYLADTFNFLPQEELAARKTNVGFRIAYAALIIIFVLAGIWTLGLLAAQTDKKIEFKNKFSHLQNLQKQVTVLREDVSHLKPFEGWKQLYEDTFKNQPRWNMVLSELALLVPSHLIIEGFQVVPEKKGQSPLWASQISGKIRANNWQEGLNLLRQFGGTLQSSPFFEVTDLNYAPEEVQTEAKTFKFQVLFTIVSEESAHEI